MGRAFPSFSIWKSMQFQTQSGTNIKDEYYHTATRTLLNSNIKKQKTFENGSNCSVIW